MTWTTTRPTQPGPYWYKDKEFGPAIVDIILSDGVLFVDCGWGEEGRIPVSEYGYGIYVEWAGPIPEPTEYDDDDLDEEPNVSKAMTRKEELQTRADLLARQLGAGRGGKLILNALQQIEREVWSKINARLAMVVEDKDALHDWLLDRQKEIG